MLQSMVESAGFVSPGLMYGLFSSCVYCEYALYVPAALPLRKVGTMPPLAWHAVLLPHCPSFCMAGNSWLAQLTVQFGVTPLELPLPPPLLLPVPPSPPPLPLPLLPEDEPEVVPDDDPVLPEDELDVDIEPELLPDPELLLGPERPGCGGVCPERPSAGP
jgi:hypothetical protein